MVHSLRKNLQTFLGFLTLALLFMGLAASVILVTERQEIRKRAAGLEISTNKDTYKGTEVVKIRVRNTGTEPVVLDQYHFEIQTLIEGEEPRTIYVWWKPKEEKVSGDYVASLDWQQKSMFCLMAANTAEAGNYQAVFKANNLILSTQFRIEERLSKRTGRDSFLSTLDRPLDRFSPLPTRSPAPTPTPNPACNQSCKNNYDCPGQSIGCFSKIEGGKCRNGGCMFEEDCICPPAPTPSPRTGEEVAVELYITALFQGHCSLTIEPMFPGMSESYGISCGDPKTQNFFKEKGLVATLILTKKGESPISLPLRFQQGGRSAINLGWHEPTDLAGFIPPPVKPGVYTATLYAPGYLPISLNNVTLTDTGIMYDLGQGNPARPKGQLCLDFTQGGSQPLTWGDLDADGDIDEEDKILLSANLGKTKAEPSEWADTWSGPVEQKKKECADWPVIHGGKEYVNREPCAVVRASFEGLCQSMESGEISCKKEVPVLLTIEGTLARRKSETHAIILDTRGESVFPATFTTAVLALTTDNVATLHANGYLSLTLTNLPKPPEKWTSELLTGTSNVGPIFLDFTQGLTKSLILGDINIDGKVDEADMTWFTNGGVSPTLTTPTPVPTGAPTPGETVGDFNGDGVVDLLDFEIFRDLYTENL